jgi:hypothetical protein
MPGVSFVETESEDWYRISDTRFKEMIEFYKWHPHFVQFNLSHVAYNYYWFDNVYDWVFVEYWLRQAHPGVLTDDDVITDCMLSVFKSWHEDIYNDVVKPFHKSEI